ncbi:hypothetical protein EVAR_8431_1 [Eumeta japonica]|uniref:Uncharacterized protein n=1 Tax=Eumeta variegata TaxID=151549 RepID=A0A4C1WCP7_EUMVA|nr:hypothetical protein EVAR_8431_1 [Eumeta japonica]
MKGRWPPYALRRWPMSAPRARAQTARRGGRSSAEGVLRLPHRLVDAAAPRAAPHAAPHAARSAPLT